MPNAIRNISKHFIFKKDVSIYKMSQKWWVHFKNSLNQKKAIKMHRLLHSPWETSKFSLTQNLKFSCKVCQLMALLIRRGLKKSVWNFAKKSHKKLNNDIFHVSTMCTNNMGSLSVKSAETRGNATVECSHMQDSSAVVCVFWWYTWSFKYPYRKKSQGVKFGEKKINPCRFSNALNNPGLNNTIIETFVEEIEDFSCSTRTRTVLHEPRGVLRVL